MSTEPTEREQVTEPTADEPHVHAAVAGRRTCTRPSPRLPRRAPARHRPPVADRRRRAPGVGAVGRRRAAPRWSCCVISLVIGFNLALFVVGTVILGGVAQYVWSRSVEGPRRATDRGVTYAIVAAFAAGADAAGLAALHRDLARHAAASTATFFTLVDARRDRRGRRRHPRDLRHADHHRLRDDHLGADRHHGRDLPAGVRHRAPQARADVLRRRHDRHPVDRRRPVRLRAVLDLLRAGRPHGHHGLGRAVGADDPDRRALHRGDAADRAELAARGVLRARRAEVADDHQGRPADRARRHRHRRRARDRPHHRRDRPAADHHRRRARRSTPTRSTAA